VASGTAASAGRETIGEMVPSMSQNNAVDRGAAAAAAHEAIQPLRALEYGLRALHDPPRFPLGHSVPDAAGRAPSPPSSGVKFAGALPIGREREMTEPDNKLNGPLPGGKPRDMRADPYLKSMLLGLIEDSFLHTGTFTQFAAEVLQVIAYAVTVPVAFTEGFLKAYLSIEAWWRTRTDASRSSPRKAPRSRT